MTSSSGGSAFTASLSTAGWRWGTTWRPALQAQGYATEALRALAGWALRQSEVEVVVGRTEAGNIASRRVMEKAGFIPSGGPDAEGLHSFELRGPQKEDGGANH